MSYHTTSPTEIVECVAAYMKARGLEPTLAAFAGMEQLLSSLSCWSEVKSQAEQMFAHERERQEQLELARAKAAAPNVYQFLPSAQAGVSMSNPQFDGSMYEIKGNDNVNLGGNKHE